MISKAMFAVMLAKNVLLTVILASFVIPIGFSYEALETSMQLIVLFVIICLTLVLTFVEFQMVIEIIEKVKHGNK